MHLLTILAFALLFWQAEEPGRFVQVLGDDWVWTLASVLLLPTTCWLFGRLATRIAISRIRSTPEAIDSAHQSYVRCTVAIRAILLTGFAWTIFGTNWPLWLQLGELWAPLQIVGDVVVLAPYAAGLIALWIATFPLEQMLRTGDFSADGAGASDLVAADADDTAGSSSKPWTRRTYLDFHIRHYLLIVAVPMTLVLFTANLTRTNETALRAAFDWYWAPEALLSLVAGMVFLAAPLFLTRIWRTRSLADGELRSNLEKHCQDIGLGIRDILVWDCDGMMINAAVMGVIKPCRYVLLSDALIDSMSRQQIESVFGHEVGHASQRHIQYFLLFAFIGWLFVGGSMELLAYLAGLDWRNNSGSVMGIQAGVGLVAIGVWGAGFGWISRRFERQADICGAKAVSPDAAGCTKPCSVHGEGIVEADAKMRVCMTGATVFASALDRVANLSGIPHEEHSWRHASIGHRIRMLKAVAGDPSLATQFERMIRRVKLTMLVVAVVGALASSYYFGTTDFGGDRSTQAKTRVVGSEMRKPNR